MSDGSIVFQTFMQRMWNLERATDSLAQTKASRHETDLLARIAGQLTTRVHILESFCESLRVRIEAIERPQGEFADADAPRNEAQP
jgi:hypothetical protein